MGLMLVRKEGLRAVGSNQQSCHSRSSVNIQKLFLETCSVPVPARNIRTQDSTRKPRSLLAMNLCFRWEDE